MPRSWLRSISRKAPSLLGFAAALLLAIGVSAAPALAQSAGGGVTVKGQVIDRSSGRPVVGAHVSFPTSRREAVTDARGNFIVDGVSAGQQSFVVQLAGYETARQVVELVPGERLITIRLRHDPAADARSARLLGHVAMQ